MNCSSVTAHLSFLLFKLLAIICLVAAVNADEVDSQLQHEPVRYVLVQRGDSLWAIATANKPTNEVSIQRYLLAILHENPHAFANGSINGLLAGATLRLPNVAAAVNYAEPVDEPASFYRAGALAFSVLENASGSIGEIAAATDPDGDKLTYRLSGADATAFRVDPANRHLSVAESAILDFELQSVYEFELVATDPNGLQSRGTIVVTIGNVNETPAFLADGEMVLRIPENTTGVMGDRVTANDPDGDALIYRLVGTDAPSFAVNATNGQLSVGVATLLDFETKVAYAFEVVAADPYGLQAGRKVVVAIENVNEEPAFAREDDEIKNEPVGEVVVRPGDTLGKIAKVFLPSDDVSVQQHMLAILRENRQAFVKDNVNGLLAGAKLRMPDVLAVSAVSPDDAIREIRKQNAAWLDYAGTRTGGNKPPEFHESEELRLRVRENATGSLGSPVTATDPEGSTVKYHLGGEDASFFDINAATGQLSVKEETKLDFSAQTAYRFEVVAADPHSLFVRRAVVVTKSIDAAGAIPKPSVTPTTPTTTTTTTTATTATTATRATTTTRATTAISGEDRCDLGRCCWRRCRYCCRS